MIAEDSSNEFMLCLSQSVVHILWQTNKINYGTLSALRTIAFVMKLLNTITYSSLSEVSPLNRSGGSSTSLLSFKSLQAKTKYACSAVNTITRISS